MSIVQKKSPTHSAGDGPGRRCAPHHGSSRVVTAYNCNTRRTPPSSKEPRRDGNRAQAEPSRKPPLPTPRALHSKKNALIRRGGVQRHRKTLALAPVLTLVLTLAHLFVDRPSSAQRQKNAAGSAAATPSSGRLAPLAAPAAARFFCGAPLRRSDLAVVARRRRELRSQAAEVGGGGDHRRHSATDSKTSRRMGLLFGDNQAKYSCWHTAAKWLHVVYISA